MLEIKSKLAIIFNRRFEDEERKWDEKKLKTELLGPEWGFQARDLVYLFMDIEREFDIEIPEGDIISGKFTTLSRIIDIIKKILNENDG